MSQPANDDYLNLSDDEASYHEEAADNGNSEWNSKKRYLKLETMETSEKFFMEWMMLKEICEKPSGLEGLEKGYDRFQQLLSQLEAHGAEVSTEDANHKFLRSLPPAWSNLAMTMRTKPEDSCTTLSID
ncbi:hypothetical protein Tco_1501687 [Tanacetum coccineum]